VESGELVVTTRQACRSALMGGGGMQNESHMTEKSGQEKLTQLKLLLQVGLEKIKKEWREADWGYQKEDTKRSQSLLQKGSRELSLKPERESKAVSKREKRKQSPRRNQSTGSPLVTSAGEIIWTAGKNHK